MHICYTKSSSVIEYYDYEGFHNDNYRCDNDYIFVMLVLFFLFLTLLLFQLLLMSLIPPSSSSSSFIIIFFLHHHLLPPSSSSSSIIIFFLFMLPPPPSFLLLVSKKLFHCTITVGQQKTYQNLNAEQLPVEYFIRIWWNSIQTLT